MLAWRSWHLITLVSHRCIINWMYRPKVLIWQTGAHLGQMVTGEILGHIVEGEIPGRSSSHSSLRFSGVVSFSFSSCTKLILSLLSDKGQHLIQYIAYLKGVEGSLSIFNFSHPARHHAFHSHLAPCICFISAP